MLPAQTTTRLDLPHGPVPVNLKRLFPQASFVGCGDILTSLATDSSRECRANTLFAVIRGTRTDGADHIRDAVSHGAMALLVDRPQPAVQIPQCIVPDVRRAYAELCAALAGYPARHLALAGVTGTNGKTTTTWLIRSILRAAGQQAGLLGTIEYHDGVNSVPAQLTTPDPATLSHWLGKMVAHRTTCAALEVSSHALDQKRLAGTLLDAAVITNITQDHFDYHKTFSAYRQAKLRIFDYLKPAGVSIVNIDDEGSRSCLSDAPRRLLTYSLREPADVTARIIESSAWGTRFELVLAGERLTVSTPLIGQHNVSNCLAAAAVAHTLGVGSEAIIRGIASLHNVPGRVERIDRGQTFPVFVDYAHTPDALERSLAAVRPFARGRLICVFGAGGDRDRTKRPLMGRVAAARADLAVVTSDNPRTENPGQIIDEIVAGMAASHRRPYVEPDRRSAIRWALQHAGPDDLVLIAGKGHETEQILGTVRTHFDDREVARECLSEMTGGELSAETDMPLWKPLRV